MLLKAFIRLFLSLLLLNLALSASAQDDPTDFVLDAFARLSDGYRFTYTADFAQTYITDDLTSAVTVGNRYDVTGEVSASGDYVGETSTRMTAGGGTLEESLPFEFETARVDGVVYLRLGENRATVPDLIDIASGWHRVNDLKIRGDEADGKLLDSLSQLKRPSTLPVRENRITSITEIEPQEIDGVSMRGFELILDGARIYRESVLRSGMFSTRHVAMLALLMESGEFDYRLTVWIGAEDGQLYRVEGSNELFVPYFSLGILDDAMPNYDFEQEETFQFDITDHGMVDPIEPPIVEPAR